MEREEAGEGGFGGERRGKGKRMKERGRVVGGRGRKMKGRKEGKKEGVVE